MTSTFERLRVILIRDYPITPDSVVHDAPLEALGIDSLGIAELLFNIEDEFKVTLPPEMVQITTLDDVVNFIDGLVAAQCQNKAQPARLPALATTAG
jgi:acyl carrier protein